MAGRGHGAHLLDHRDRGPPLLARAQPAPPLLPHPAAILHSRHHPPGVLIIDDRRLLPARPRPDDRLAAQHREIDALLLDNQRLAATHVALTQELAAAQHDHRLAASAAARARAEREAEVRAVIEQAARTEVGARAVEGMRVELAQVRTDVQRLGAARDELVERLQGLKADLARARAELGQASALRAEIEAMRHEVQRGRAAVEYEKKVHADNLIQHQAMEKNTIAMAHEVEKLHAELANAEKRARAAAAAAATATATANPVYPGAYAKPDMVYGATNAEAYVMQQAQGAADQGSLYGSGAASHAQYNVQQTHVQR